MKYRRIPIEVEAFQFTEEVAYNRTLWPKWLMEAYDNDIIVPYFEGMISILTLEGELVVSFNDYIIQGIKGELYPCKPDIFKELYEKIEE